MWKPRPRWLFSHARVFGSFQTRFAGRPALTADKEGYRCGRLFGRLVSAHRVAFVIMTGRWPEEMVDHINGDKADNRWENLRAASAFQNGVNRGANQSATSSFKGVAWETATGLWRAVGKIDSKLHSLGRFHSEEDAARAYDAFALKHHGDFARLNLPPDPSIVPRRASRWDARGKAYSDKLAAALPGVMQAVHNGEAYGHIGSRFGLPTGVISKMAREQGVIRVGPGRTSIRASRQKP